MSSILRSKVAVISSFFLTLYKRYLYTSNLEFFLLIVVNEYFENFFSDLQITQNSTSNVFSNYLFKDFDRGEIVRKNALSDLRSANPYLYEAFISELEYVGGSYEGFYWGSMYYGARNMANITEGYFIPVVQPNIISNFYEEEVAIVYEMKNSPHSKANEKFRNQRMKEMFIAMYKDRINSDILDGFWKAIIDSEKGEITPWIRPLFNTVLLIHRQQKFEDI